MTTSKNPIKMDALDHTDWVEAEHIVKYVRKHAGWHKLLSGDTKNWVKPIAALVASGLVEQNTDGLVRALSVLTVGDDSLNLIDWGNKG